MASFPPQTPTSDLNTDPASQGDTDVDGPPNDMQTVTLRKASKIQDIARFLEALRVGAHMIDLPQFTLAGMQSAGKTMLLSVLAGRQIGGLSHAGWCVTCPTLSCERIRTIPLLC